ncbi:MAG: enoyl-CoA hydratase/isomerase family protein [Pseudomonadota bacterium]
MALIEISDLHHGVRQLLFNRPDKLNALSTPLMAAFDNALDEAATDPSVRVIVLRGAGGRAFVAGADIGEYQGDKRAAFIAYQMNSRRVFDKLERVPKPTICAIDGFALGGGFEIALCCDMIIVSEDAQLGLPEGRLGLSPGGGGTQRLVRAVGKYAASDLMLAGWRWSGARAHQLGVAADCVASAEDGTDPLGAAVLTRARACLKTAPLAQAEMKRLLREGYDAPSESAKSYEQEVLFRLYSTHDGQEGIDAFLEKRTPEFKGA